jgi:hypothetical protein
MPGKASTRATRQVQQSMGHPQAASLSAPSTPAQRTQAPSPNKAPPKQSPPSYPTRSPPHPKDMAPASYQKANPAPRTACHYRRPEGRRKACGAAGAGPGRRARSGATRASPKETPGSQPNAPEPPATTAVPKDSREHAVLRVQYGDKRTETITAPQPQRNGRRPQEKHPRPTWTAPKPAQCPHRRPQPPCKPRTRERDVRAARASQR